MQSKHENIIIALRDQVFHWVIGKYNTPTLRRDLTDYISGYLAGQYTAGYVDNADVVCNDTNNTFETIDKSELHYTLTLDRNVYEECLGPHHEIEM